MKYLPFLLFVLVMPLAISLPAISFFPNVPSYLNPNKPAFGFSMPSDDSKRTITLNDKYKSTITEYNTLTTYYGQIEYGLGNKSGIRLGGIPLM